MLEAAGELAMKYFLRVTPARKKDRTLVTTADLAVQSFLIEELGRAFPEDGLIAEEEGLWKAPTTGSRYWTIDPIDGTASFVAGMTTWSIALGLIEQGQPVAGFIWMPTTRDFFYTTSEGGVYRNEHPMALKMPPVLEDTSILFVHSSPHQRFTLSPAYSGKVMNLGTASAHLSYVATGGADAVLIGHDKIWDLAPGLALLSRNGGVLRYIRGSDVCMKELLSGRSAPHPMLGGHPDVVRQLESLIDYHSPRFPW